MTRLLLAGLLALLMFAGGCQESRRTANYDPATGETPGPMDSGIKAAEARSQVQTREAAERFQRGAEKFGAEVKETTAQAAETIQEGVANFSAEVREEYPQVVASMQRQFDAMNEWGVEAYRDAFATDAPERDKLVDAFQSETQFKPRYTIERFTVTKADATEAQATVVILYKGTDIAKPGEAVRKTYLYTFRKQVDSDDWRVFSIIEVR